MIVYCVFSLNVSKKGLFINPFTKAIGDISFEIYLCHMIVYRVIEKLHLLHITKNDYVNYFIVFIAVFIGAILVSIIGKRVILIAEKIVMKKC